MRRDDSEPTKQPGQADGGRPPEDAAARTRAEERQLAQLRRTRQARVAKVAVALAIVVVLIVFVIANSQPVKVDFVVVTRHPRLIWVMVACAVLGGVAGYLIGRPGRQIHLHKDRPPEDARG